MKDPWQCLPPMASGQEFSLPVDAEPAEDLYVHRAPLTASMLSNAFVGNSRTIAARATGQQAVDPVATPETAGDALTISEPNDGATISARTIRVAGTVGEGVERVRVNGYLASFDPERNTFTQELALPDTEEIEIRIEALDARGLTVQEARRTVRRDIQPPPAPAITQPAPGGSVYRTAIEQFEVRGTAPEGVAGIVVNDYRLQLFKKGDTEWSYLASVRLGNAVKGVNLFEVVAIDDAGNRSEPVVLTIRIEEGEQGIVSGPSSAGAAAATSSAASSINIAELPNNAPIQPGSVTVTAPIPGSSATMTGTELLLEGTSPAQAASLWVNDYKLQLFSPDKQTWTYIARVEWGTLKQGTNAFVITARNAENQILDRMTYTVEKQ
jgi:hypothetical protein